MENHPQKVRNYGFLRSTCMQNDYEKLEEEEKGLHEQCYEDPFSEM